MIRKQILILFSILTIVISAGALDNATDMTGSRDKLMDFTIGQE